MANLQPLLTVAAAALALGATTAAYAEGPTGPGIEALDLHTQGRPARPSIDNRFFTKSERFELSPMFGYVPNNAFAQRFVGGVGVGYHFSETFAIQGLVTYSPDLGETDLKGLTRTLLRIAAVTGSGDFQQPLDKVTLGFSANAVWAPLYGKINLIGETILNFDLYFVAGLSMNAKTNYFARLDVPNDPTSSVTLGDPVGNEVKFGPNVGMGMNFFVTQSVAVKVDARMNFFVDEEPQYDPTVPALNNRLYNNFVTSGGVSVFFPKMQERARVY